MRPLRALLVCALAAVSCYSPSEPLCSFQCGDNRACPADYQCLADNYCHLHGQAGDCGYPDLAMPSSSTDMKADAAMPPTDGPGD